MRFLTAIFAALLFVPAAYAGAPVSAPIPLGPCLKVNYGNGVYFVLDAPSCNPGATLSELRKEKGFAFVVGRQQNGTTTGYMVVTKDKSASN